MNNTIAIDIGIQNIDIGIQNYSSLESTQARNASNPIPKVSTSNRLLSDDGDLLVTVERFRRLSSLLKREFLLLNLARLLDEGAGNAESACEQTGRQSR